MIDIYCERLAAGLWQEPLNAISNLVFIIVAYLLWRKLVNSKHSAYSLQGLVLLIFAIGIGSALFHTFASPWAAAADVIPILLFKLLFLWVYARHIMQLSTAKALLLLAGLIAAILLALVFKHYLNGSILYIPALLMLYILGFYHYRYADIQQGRGLLLIAGALLTTAIFFRSIDMQICHSVAWGTHFLWHLINGLVLYYLMLGLLTAYQK